MKTILKYRTYTQASADNKAVTTEVITITVAGNINPEKQIIITGKELLNEILQDNHDGSIKFISMEAYADITITKETEAPITASEKFELEENYDKAVKEIFEGNTKAINASARKLSVLTDETAYQDEIKEEIDYIKDCTKNINNMIKDYITAVRARGL